MSDDHRAAAAVHEIDTDERVRVQTRALLMALSRKREWYFVQSIPLELVIALLTLGLRPLLTSADRFDRWRRLEWIHYAELARWLGDRTDDPIASELERYADGAANIRRQKQGSWCFVIGSIFVAVFALWDVGHLLIVPVVAHLPAYLMPSLSSQTHWFGWHNLAYASLVSLGWCALLVAVVQHSWSTSVWLLRCNELLVSQAKRPIPSPNGPLPVGAILLALIIGTVGPTWAGALIVVIAMQNRYIIATRAARLAFIERMLEWMDRSGLAVEFDVEEIAPADLAATVA